MTTNLTDLWTATPSHKRGRELATKAAEHHAGDRTMLELDYLAELQANTDALIRQAVATARAENVPWEQIGAQLGITKQGAQQRFGG